MASNKSVISMTLSMLLQCRPNPGGDNFLLADMGVDGRPIEVHHVRIVGRILSVDDSDVSKMVISLDDGTGNIEVPYYHSDDDLHYGAIHDRLR